MITIVDYGMGNIGSLENMVNRVGGKVQITTDPDQVRMAEKLILPGVGHFDQAMTRLKSLGIKDALDDAVLSAGKPILCICLGAQLVTESSEEGSETGFGWVKGRTLAFNPAMGLRIPHMGWNDVSVKKKSSLFEGMPEDPCFYFVHSYYMTINDSTAVLTTTKYGCEFVSAIEQRNIYAMQFHPEKSHKFGMCIIRNFVEA